MDEEGADEEADADEEVEGVDERSTPLWSESKNKKHAVGGQEDSITSKLKKVENGRKEVDRRSNKIVSPEGIDKLGAAEDWA